MAGRKAAVEELVKAGVSTEAAAAGISRIINLRDSMRGAMLLDADTGLRVDSLGERGVRVSKMDSDNSERYEARLLEKGLLGIMSVRLWYWHLKWPVLLGLSLNYAGRMILNM